MFGAGKLMKVAAFRLAPALILAGGMSGAAKGQIKIGSKFDDRSCGTTDCRQVWVPPVYDRQARIVVIPAKYDTVYREVWREPRYDDRWVLVQVPAVTRWKQVENYDSCGRFTGYEWKEIIVTPACERWEMQRVLVREGGWDRVADRVLVCPEKRETVWDNVLVRDGHWKMVCDDKPITLLDDLRNSQHPQPKPVLPVSLRAVPDNREYPASGRVGIGKSPIGGFDRMTKDMGSARLQPTPTRANVDKRPMPAEKR